MKQLFLLLFVLSVIPVLAQDSVADAARASRQKQAAPKRVLTDDDLPSTTASGPSSSVSPDDMGKDWAIDLVRVRAAYSQVCGDPSLHGAKSLPPEKQKLLDNAMAPLKARIAKEQDDMKVLKAHLERLEGEEQTETSSAGSDKQKVTAIHEHYEQLRREDQVKVAVSMQIAEVVMKEMTAIATECAQAAK